MRKASAIELDDAQREQLVKLAHSNTTEVRLARRASIVLLAADGLDNYRIGEMLGVGRIQAGRWRERYAGGGLQAIEQDLPRGGRKPKVDPAEIVRLTTQTTPEGATQWSTRTLAAVAGVSDTTIQRVWKSRGLKPHRVKRFKVSRGELAEVNQLKQAFLDSVSHDLRTPLGHIREALGLLLDGTAGPLQATQHRVRSGDGSLHHRRGAIQSLC